MQGPDGRPNGNAFVLFDKPEEAAKAIGKYLITWLYYNIKQCIQASVTSRY